jgi:ubiquinol-cytochrome c reductase cytochrome b subunit
MTEPEAGRLRVWLNSTGGVVVLLLLVQFATGALLTFYYVPSVDHAYTTVSFVEKVLSSGSWIRSLHHYGSQWLPLFVFLHLVRLWSVDAYKDAKTKWIAAVVLLGLVMSAGATGYSLPWDARAFFSTRVAEGLVAGLPLVGRNARLWLLAGNQISTLTLSRFFALHVLVTPFLIVLIVLWRLFGESIATFFSGPSETETRRVCWPTLSRNAVAAGLVFVALGIWALKFPAPLGPSVTSATPDYLPRPGAQFLWLYESLKHVPGGFDSLVGVGVPGAALLVLILLPWLNPGLLKRLSPHPQRTIGTVILLCGALWVVTMTTVSYVSDHKDPRTRQQLVRQATQEEAFRKEPFKPRLLSFDDDFASQATGEASVRPPAAYTRLCVNCHGERGEGAKQGTLRFPPLIGVSAKPRRTAADIVALLNDPAAYGLELPMKSFATKLTEEEKREIAEWIVKLR